MYNVPPKDSLVTFGWCSDPYQLRDFLSLVKPAYGWTNEAIELALHFAKEQHQRLGKGGFKQMIIIGDAGANTRDDVKYKTKNSEFASSWNNSRSPQYKTPMYWEDELKYFQEKGIKVNTLYLKPGAKKDFQTIATIKNCWRVWHVGYEQYTKKHG